MFHLKDTLWCLIVPNLLLNAFNIILIRNYYRFSIPKAIVESARIDGAGEFTTFVRIVFPMSCPSPPQWGCSPPSCSGTTGRTACITSPAPTWYSIQQVLQIMSSDPHLLSNGTDSPGVNRDIPTTHNPYGHCRGGNRLSSSPTRFSKNISSRGLRWACEGVNWMKDGPPSCGPPLVTIIFREESISMVVKFNFLSKYLGMQTNVTMCLPSFSFADIMGDRKEVYVQGMKYQTLYLLHGGSGTIRIT